MWHDLTRFLYITNREITVICLCAMFPLDVVLFYLMSRFGLWKRLAYGFSLVVTFGWALSWFAEPARQPSLEPIFREVFLMTLMIIKALRIVQALQTDRHGRVQGLAVRPMTKRERTVSLLAGAGGLSFSTAVAIGFWLFTAYQNNEDKETMKVEALNQQTLMISEFRYILTRFELKQDSTIRVLLKNTSKIDYIQNQGAKGISMAEQAAKKADRVASKLQAKEAVEKRGKPVRVDKIEKKETPVNWYDPLIKRFDMDAMNQKLPAEAEGWERKTFAVDH
jgi:hypothetical protein